MSRELMKMVGVSISSSLCTAVFVVACTASADKMDDDERGSGDELAEDDGDDGGGSGGDDDDGDGPGDGGDDDDNSSGDDDDDDDGGLADLVTQVGEMATQIDDLVAFQTSMLCYLERQRDDQGWDGANIGDTDDPDRWYDIVWDDAGMGDRGEGFSLWTQGPNSDAQKAYDDCF